MMSENNTDSYTSDTERWTCDRCGDKIERGYPLDAVAHPHTESVCDDCLKPTDEVVDV